MVSYMGKKRDSNANMLVSADYIVEKLIYRFNLHELRMENELCKGVGDVVVAGLIFHPHTHTIPFHIRSDVWKNSIKTHTTRELAKFPLDVLVLYADLNQGSSKYFCPEWRDYLTTKNRINISFIIMIN